MIMNKKVLVFAGTQDGREIAQILVHNGIKTDVCVATSYGEEMLQDEELLHVKTGRMDVEEMERLMKEASYAAVIDATHPYATEVTRNIAEASRKAQVPCLRYSRETYAGGEAGEIHYVDSVEEVAQYLNHLSGNILLTTGSKDIGRFCDIVEEKERLFVRILPSVESITLCERAGIEHKHMIAMHGPFSEAMNEAILKQYQIAVLVTKESGVVGGYPAKLQAAANCQVQAVVIRNPEQKKQYHLTQLLEELSSILSMSINLQPAKELIVAGIGMGAGESMTVEVKNALQQADVIFGADRILDAVKGYQTPQVPIYQKDKIIAYLKQHPEYQHPVAVMSGDVGFYSGSSAFQENTEDIKVTFLCGISSVSYFSAKLGIAWNDMHITSIHGRKANLIGKLRRFPKMFCLFSDLSEMVTTMQEMVRYQLENYKIYLGYQLSYPEEVIRQLAPKDWQTLSDMPEKGLYVAVFIQEKEERMPLIPAISDEQFIRDKVPMTKAEIRELSLARLQLREHAVVWDIGAGTGSVSVACAILSDTIQVYAVEQKEEAADLIEANKEHFGAASITVVRAKAPEGLEELPTPTHVFIGGSGGKLGEIFNLVWKKNPNARVVLNAITLETVAEVMELLKQYPHRDEDIVQVAVSKAGQVGRYHLMQAQNPVYIISFTLTE